VDLESSTPDKICTKLVVARKQFKHIRYVMKEIEGSENDRLPTDFMMTLFHICFMYPSNITVVSKLTKEVVYNCNFSDSKILRGIDFDREANQLLAFSHHKHI
jgi:hypothetical protein